MNTKTLLRALCLSLTLIPGIGFAAGDNVPPASSSTDAPMVELRVPRGTESIPSGTDWTQVSLDAIIDEGNAEQAVRALRAMAAGTMVRYMEYDRERTIAAEELARLIEEVSTSDSE